MNVLLNESNFVWIIDGLQGTQKPDELRRISEHNVYVDYVFSEYTGNILPLLINTSIYLYFMSRKHLDSLTNNFITTAYLLNWGNCT
jgi:hypothetical protein